jgi:hypothetical protein
VGVGWPLACMHHPSARAGPKQQQALPVAGGAASYVHLRCRPACVLWQFHHTCATLIAYQNFKPFTISKFYNIVQFTYTETHQSDVSLRDGN